MEWLKMHLRQLRWQLTLSYAAVTVVSLLALSAIAAGYLFSKVLLPEYALTPQDWVDIARLQSQAPYGELLSKSSDPDVFSRIIQTFDPTIVANKLFLFNDLEIYARTTGVVDLIVTDSAGRLLAVSHRNEPPLLSGVHLGEKFDPGLVPGLEGPLTAALQGRTSADVVYHKFETGDGLLIAIPIFHPERLNEVVGVIVYYLRDISTEADRGPYFGAFLLRSLVVILIAAVIVGTIFGGLTAEGLAGRFRRLANASEAWSKGDFSTRIQDPSSDEIGKLAGRLDGMAEDLQELVQKRQELAVTQERNRLARDLHDSAKQLALAASFQIATARKLFQRDPETAAQNLQEAEKLIDKVRSELTGLIHELRSSQLDGKEFDEIVRTYAAEWAHSNGIGVQFEIQPVDVSLEAGEVMYRILQEALANVARHSGASQAFIQVQQQDGEIQLSVRDDGVGFDPGSLSRGLGLASMRERAEGIGGSTRVASQPGKGTEVRVVLPLIKKEVKND